MFAALSEGRVSTDELRDEVLRGATAGDLGSLPRPGKRSPPQPARHHRGRRAASGRGVAHGVEDLRPDPEPDPRHLRPRPPPGVSPTGLPGPLRLGREAAHGFHRPRARCSACRSTSRATPTSSSPGSRAPTTCAAASATISSTGSPRCWRISMRSTRSATATVAPSGPSSPSSPGRRATRSAGPGWTPPRTTPRAKPPTKATTTRCGPCSTASYSAAEVAPRRHDTVGP